MLSKKVLSLLFFVLTAMAAEGLFQDSFSKWQVIGEIGK